MKQLFTILLFCIAFTTAKATTTDTLPNTNAQPFYYDYYRFAKFVEAGKGYLFAFADTNFTPKKPMAIIRTADSSLYIYNGKCWKNYGATVITGSQVTAALGYTPYNATNPNRYWDSLQAKSWANGTFQTALGYTPLRPSNNLSDLASAATARINLGLGSFALKNSIDTIDISSFYSKVRAAQSYAGVWQTSLNDMYYSLGNLAVGQSTINSAYKLDVNGNFRALGASYFGAGSQGDIFLGTVNLSYPSTIKYDQSYQFSIKPASGSTGLMNILGSQVTLLDFNEGFTFTDASHVGKIAKNQGGSSNLSLFDIAGATPQPGYTTRGGSVRVYPGADNGTGGAGYVVLNHNGSSVVGKLLVGTATENTTTAIAEFAGKITASSENISSLTQASHPYPSMTAAQRAAITMTSANYGDHVYQTDGTEGVYVYKSSGWIFAY